MEPVSINEETNNNNNLVSGAKKLFNQVGLRYFIYAIVALVSQLIFAAIVRNIYGDNDIPSVLSFLSIIIPMYVIAFPVLGLLLKNVEVTKLEKNKLSVGKIIKYMLMTAALVGVGAIIGVIFHFGLVFILGGQIDTNSNASIAQLMMSSDAFWRILTVGILAPIVEEMIFRKFLIDRIVKHGELLAMLTSGIMFGLFHGNFQQFFFATFIGIFFSYIYIRTGKVWYTIILHMAVNLTTSIFTVYFISKVDMEVMTEMSTDPYKFINSDGSIVEGYADKMVDIFAYVGWIGFLCLLVFIGIIMWVISLKSFRLETRPNQIDKKDRFKVSVLNVGMILFVLFTLFNFVQSYMAILM